MSIQMSQLQYERITFLCLHLNLRTMVEKSTKILTLAISCSGVLNCNIKLRAIVITLRSGQGHYI